MNKNLWKGGPRSQRSYVMDYHRQSEEPWENKDKGRKGIANVSPHYRKTKKGSTKVRFHKRHLK